MNVIARSRAEPSADPCVLMCGAVVHDEMHVQVGRHVGIAVVEELGADVLSPTGSAAAGGEVTFATAPSEDAGGVVAATPR